MSRQLRFDTPAELATKMIAKLSQDELNVTTRALIVHINSKIPVKQIEQAVAASNTKAESTGINLRRDRLFHKGFSAKCIEQPSQSF